MNFISAGWVCVYSRVLVGAPGKVSLSLWLTLRSTDATDFLSRLPHAESLHQRLCHREKDKYCILRLHAIKVQKCLLVGPLRRSLANMSSPVCIRG